MKMSKMFMIGGIAGLGMMLMTGCSTIVVGDSALKDTPPPPKVKKAEMPKPQVVIHYHILIVPNQDPYATGFGPYSYWDNMIYNASHRKQRGRTAPNRALREDAPNNKNVKQQNNPGNPGMKPDPPGPVKK